MLEQVFLARRLRVRQMPSELREYWSVNRLGLHRDPVLKQSNLYEEGRSEPGLQIKEAPLLRQFYLPQWTYFKENRIRLRVGLSKVLADLRLQCAKPCYVGRFSVPPRDCLFRQEVEVASERVRHDYCRFCT